MSTNDSRRGAARHQGPGSPPLPRRAFAVLSGLLLALVIVAPALAHVALVKSTPADKAVLDTSPTTITLTFSESLSASESSFKLIGPTGTVGTGRVGSDDNVMTLSGLVLDGRPLGSGAYEIRWAAKGTDGHLERGKLTFTITEPTPEPTAQPSAEATAPAAEPTDAPTAATPTAAPAATGPAAATAQTGDGTTPAATSSTDVLVPIIVALIVVIGLGALVLRRSRGA